MEIKTICKDCVFYNNSVEQTCILNVYDKLQKNNYNVNIVKCASGETEILNHICTFCRPQQWADKHNNTDLDKIVQKEVEIKTTLLIYMEEGDLDELKGKIQSHWQNIVSMPLKPTKIIFINNTPYKIGEIYSICIPDTDIINNNKIKWNIEHVVGEHTPGSAIDIALQNVKTPYIMVANINFMPQFGLLSNINEFINVDLRKINLVDLEDELIYFIGTQLYKTFGGNYTKPIQNKIKEAAKEQNCEHLILEG